MTKPGDSQTKKTIQELSKEFPNKTYRELEKYRDADRVEEAIGLGHNHPPEKMTIFDEERKKFKKACTLGEMRKDRTYPDLVEVLATENEKLKKRAQEAEGELTIVKGIGNTSPEMKALQVRVKELGEINKLHQELNGKLQTRVTELEEDNKRLSQQIGDKNNFLSKMRESGM